MSARDDDGPSPSDMEDWAPEPRSDRCRCGDDLPGQCPGPANCPLCQPNTEEDEATA